MQIMHVKILQLLLLPARERTSVETDYFYANFFSDKRRFLINMTFISDMYDLIL